MSFSSLVDAFTLSCELFPCHECPVPTGRETVNGPKMAIPTILTFPIGRGASHISPARGSRVALTNESGLPTRRISTTLAINVQSMNRRKESPTAWG